MPLAEPDLKRTWLFGPGADAHAHVAMLDSGADALIVDLEDFTPPSRRDEARRGVAALLQRWRAAGRIAAVRINALDADGPLDLEAAMPARPDVVAYPMASSAAQMQALDRALADWEHTLGIEPGTTAILPVCETALGVVDVRAIASGSARIRAALLGAEDLAADLCAERQPDAVELDHARRRFLLECRAAAIEPIDAPYTFSDTEGAVREAHYARRLGYRCKSLVRAEHARPLNAALTPGDDEVRRANGTGGCLRSRPCARRRADAGRGAVGRGADLSECAPADRALTPAPRPLGFPGVRSRVAADDRQGLQRAPASEPPRYRPTRPPRLANIVVITPRNQRCPGSRCTRSCQYCATCSGGTSNGSGSARMFSRSPNARVT